MIHILKSDRKGLAPTVGQFANPSIRNQIREKIGVMFGSPETQPGGRALKFFSSVRMDIRRIGQIKESNGKVVGNRTRIKIVKNKVAPPFTESEFDIMYSEGISHSGSLVDLGVEHKILEKKGSWISYKGEMIGQGREAAKSLIKDTPVLADELTQLIKEKRRRIRDRQQHGRRGRRLEVGELNHLTGEAPPRSDKPTTPPRQGGEFP